MKNFLKIILYGTIPIAIYFLFIVLVDPYNYFGDSFKTKNKLEISKTNNEALYQILNLKNKQYERVLIGDSRIGSLNSKYINNKFKLEFQKVVLPAAKLNEIFDLAYFVNDNKNIKEIIIGMNFNMFNEFAYSSRVSEILNIYEKPLHYIFNFNIFKLSIKILNTHLFNLDINNSKPNTSKDEFWSQHLNTKSIWQYSRYKYPQKYVDAISEFDNYCLENNIQLTIILFPHHFDDIQVLNRYKLLDDKKRFYAFLGDLDALVVNYDYYNKYILDKDNFNDPVHYNADIGKIIIDEIFTNSFEWGVINKDKDFTDLKY